MGDERDDALDRVLKALGRTQLPEGLEARVAAQLERRTLETRSPEIAGVWWRGAVSGFAAALLVVGAAMAAGHFALRQAQVPAEPRTALGRVEPVSGVIPELVQRDFRRAPCGGGGMSRSLNVPVERRNVERLEVMGQPEPRFGTALTTEERSLVRMVQVADVKELAMLNPEVRAQREAEDAAQFQSFFTHPVYKPTDSASAEPTSTQLSNEPALGGNQ